MVCGSMARVVSNWRVEARWASTCMSGWPPCFWGAGSSMFWAMAIIGLAMRSDKSKPLIFILLGFECDEQR